MTNLLFFYFISLFLLFLLIFINVIFWLLLFHIYILEDDRVNLICYAGKPICDVDWKREIFK
ncbi:hypothetical protein WM46_03500 [Citrobacter freundii complex sp. CFNIH2]|nr:hypothetical protein WM46_03500 [Citrobacter freundii complex sp. CFNIH2]